MGLVAIFQCAEGTLNGGDTFFSRLVLHLCGAPMLKMNPSTLLGMLGINADPELVDLATSFGFALQAAPDKKEFLKEALLVERE